MPVHRSRCPTPRKVRYRDRLAAELAMAHAQRVAAGGYVVRRTYPCRCGSWHVTSQRRRAEVALP